MDFDMNLLILFCSKLGQMSWPDECHQTKELMLYILLINVDW
jgi:hypothetical protein